MSTQRSAFVAKYTEPKPLWNTETELRQKNRSIQMAWIVASTLAFPPPRIRSASLLPPRLAEDAIDTRPCQSGQEMRSRRVRGKAYAGDNRNNLCDVDNV